MKLGKTVIFCIKILLITHTRFGKYKLIAGLLKEEFSNLSDIPIDQLSERVRYYHRVGIKQCNNKKALCLI